MGCANFVTNSNIRQMFDWHPVPSDTRYEQKVVEYINGSITRMTRPIGPTYKSEYPHFTESYDHTGNKKHFDDDPRWDSHFSTDKGKGGEHYGTHKTAQAILDDLDEALNSLKSSR